MSNRICQGCADKCLQEQKKTRTDLVYWTRQERIIAHLGIQNERNERLEPLAERKRESKIPCEELKEWNEIQSFLSFHSLSRDD